MGKEFFQPYDNCIGLHIPDGIIEHRNLCWGAKVCYGLLVTSAEWWYCQISQKEIAQRLGIGEQRACGYIRQLKEAGLIVSKSGGSGFPNQYYFIYRADVFGGDMYKEKLEVIDEEEMQSIARKLKESNEGCRRDVRKRIEKRRNCEGKESS